MSDDSTTRADSVPAARLDVAEIGAALIRLAPTAAQLGHSRPTYTLRDYIDRDSQSPESQFVHDMLTKSTQVICDRWYGGIEYAQLIAAKLLVAKMDREDEDGQHAA